MPSLSKRQSSHQHTFFFMCALEGNSAMHCLKSSEKYPIWIMPSGSVQSIWEDGIHTNSTSSLQYRERIRNALEIYKRKPFYAGEGLREVSIEMVGLQDQMDWHYELTFPSLKRKSQEKVKLISLSLELTSIE